MNGVGGKMTTKQAAKLVTLHVMPTQPVSAPVLNDAPVPMNVLIQRSGIARQTIHFYLRKGLLPRPDRTSRTYALYHPETVDLLNTIKECQTKLRLSLDEIAELFERKNYNIHRIRADMEQLKSKNGSALAPAAARTGVNNTSRKTSDSPPSGEWMEELRRRGLIQPRHEKSATEAAELARSVAHIAGLGVSLDDLESLAKQIREQAEEHLTVFQRALDAKTGGKPDYQTAIRLFDAINQFVNGRRSEAVDSCFLAKTYLSADTFVGLNHKHLFPSESFVARLGLNREIDRLISQLNQNPEDMKALVDLSRSYYLRSDWLNLHSVAERILQRDPLNVRATADISRALFFLGRVDESASRLEQRLKVGSDPLLRFRLGQCLLLRAANGNVAEMLAAIVRKHQLAAEALREAELQPNVRRWIRLDLALDNLSLSDPLKINQPTVEELEELHAEYQGLPDKTLSPISRMTLSMGRMLVSYALYLVYNRHSNPKAEKLRRKIIQMDPDCVLATRGIAVVAPRGV